MQHEILLGLTTTPASDWKGKVEEMKKFGIKRIALFPTFSPVKKRKELYTLLEKIDGLVIPHVHLRAQDFEQWEIDWLLAHGTEVFNVHGGRHTNPVLKTIKHKLYIENHMHVCIGEEQLRDNAGICLDFQHWERAKKHFPVVAQKTEEYAKSFTIGCCHVSPLPKFKNVLKRIVKRLGAHYMCSIDELDYMQSYKQYLPKYISIELENSFKEQLEAKAYLEKLLQI
jgi:hypothetical protein